MHPAHPALRSFADELRATLVRVFAYVGGLTVIAVLATWYFEAPAVRAAIEPAVRSDWSVVERPYRAFALNSPHFPEPDYAIHRHTAGGRKDILTVGDDDSPGSRLKIEIYRPGKEIQRFGEPAAEVVQRMAELGGPYPVRSADPIPGKFGRMPVFEFTARIRGHARSCLGFARATSDPRLQIAGWYCKPDAEVVDRRALACAIEGLSLLAAASEPKVQQFFATAEQKRTFCAPLRTPRGAAMLRRNDWIEGSHRPKLRRSVAAK